MIYKIFQSEALIHYDERIEFEKHKLGLGLTFLRQEAFQRYICPLGYKLYCNTVMAFQVMRFLLIGILSQIVFAETNDALDYSK